MAGIEIRPDERAFFRFSRECGYFLGEQKYLNVCARAVMNPLAANGPVEFLVAERDGKTVFRAMTGFDRRYQERTGNKWGYFSLFDGLQDAEAGETLLDAIAEKQILWGNEALVGAVSPDGSGFFHGLCLGEAPKEAGKSPDKLSRGALTGPAFPFAREILLSKGFRRFEEDFAYLLRVPDENPDRETAEKAAKRFSLKIERLKPSLFRENWKKLPASVAPADTKTDFLREMERIRPFLNGDYSFACVSGGECLGYLLALSEPSAPLRLATLMTREDRFSSPAALVLLSAAMDACIRNKTETVEASVIRCGNAPSRRLAERYEGQKVRRYCRYYKNIKKN